jgi:hypothetical protein
MLFLSALATITNATAIYHRTHTCLIAYLELSDIFANRRNYSCYFVPRNLWILLRRPLTSKLVDV